MKKLLFGLIATVFMGVLSVAAQSAIKPAGYFTLDRIGFGKVSSYAGPCVTASGVCSGSILDDAPFFNAGIKKISDTVVSLAFSREIYESNLAYLRDGLFIGTEFSLPESVSSRIGINGEFVVARGVCQVTEREGFYFISLQRR